MDDPLEDLPLSKPLQTPGRLKIQDALKKKERFNREHEEVGIPYNIFHLYVDPEYININNMPRERAKSRRQVLEN
ncbi:hypothetical protein RUM44_004534 [Polyplax serrata]|uniref:Uncharacterized protein n=1 Tax=Polyplax serrata TaxID=468196 RepID=A0ABR1B4Y5_POLSC